MNRLRDLDIQFVKGIGPQRAELLTKELGIRNALELVQYYPRAYVDRSKTYAIADFAGEICLMYPVEEEVQNVSRKGTYKALCDGFTGDMAVNGEDTDLHVCLACEGMLEVMITTHGVGAHGATPYEGKNAIKMMCRVIDELDKIVPGVNKWTGSGSINPGVITGGARSSVVPDTCSLRVSRFTVPG